MLIYQVFSILNVVAGSSVARPLSLNAVTNDQTARSGT